MPLLKKTIMWAFFLAAMYFGGSMTQSSNNLLQGMGFMSILAALICLYLVLKLIWGPLSHYIKLILCVAVVWYCAYSIGLFNGNTLQSFLSGTPVPEGESAVAEDNIAMLEELDDEMFADASTTNTADRQADKQPEVQSAAVRQGNSGGLIGWLKNLLFGKPKTENTASTRAFNPLDYPEIKGYPKVLTGSILLLNGIKIKLFGIDAPDRDQICINHLKNSYNCGVMSVRWLQEWLNGKEVSCHILSKVERGWATGSCFTDNEQYDVAAVVVNAGWAVSYTRSTDIYVPYERQAAEAHRGMWSGTFYKPWDWRKLQNRKFKIKVNYSGKGPKLDGSGGGFWGLF